ncbi:hypothetical protein IWX62_002140 [Arthrobacter sp. CAN_A1]
MKPRTAALLGTILLLIGTVFLTGCDDALLPQMPSVEKQNHAENQDEIGH